MRKEVGRTVIVLPSLCHDFVMESGVEPRTTGTSIRSTKIIFSITYNLVIQIIDNQNNTNLLLQ